MPLILEHAVIEDFRSVVAARLGLAFEDQQESLADVLRQRLDAGGYSGYQQYRRHLLSSQPELRMVAEQLTVCETYFFRYSEHFRAFTEIAVPARTRTGRTLQLLSAGCSSGEEAYSMAMTMLDSFPGIPRENISIHGFDVNANMVAKAVRARYPDWSLRDTPAGFRAKYFCGEGRDLALDEGVKSMATFEQRNLVEDDALFWRPGSFDIIFCRNVIMYLTADAVRAVIGRITTALAPGGFLFLGHAETLRGISHEFHLRHTHETFYYQRRQESEEAEPPQASAAGKASKSFVPASPDNSWFETIRQASGRIATLTNGTNGKSSVSGQARSTAQPPKPAPLPLWDRALAIELMRRERFAEAIDLLHGLPSGTGNDPDVQMLLAVLLTNHGDSQEAEKICLHLLRLDELNAGAHYLIALCREHASDRASAVEHDQAAIYLDPKFAMPHLHLGLMARRAADLETARKELGLAMTLLEREDASRILLFGGGFTRETLTEFCSAELRACGGRP